MLSLIIKATQFLVYRLLIVVVDRVSRLPRSGVQPEVERLLRENPALKAQVRALVLEHKSERGARPKVSLRTRAAQVFAYLLTRGDSAFHNYYLSASETTIDWWATKLRRGPWPWRRRNLGRRPPLAQDLKDLIIRLKTENPLWGAHRIKDELARMGVMVSEPTIQKVLREAGFQPTGGHPLNLDKWRAAAKDAIWALDFFFVRTAKGVWLNVLLVIDLHTKEILELHACDAWGPTAERAIKSVRLEVLNHIRVRDVEEWEWFLDECRAFYNEHRANHATEGQMPAAFGQGSQGAEVIDLDQVRRRRLVRWPFAPGLLNAYELANEETAAA